MSRAGFGPGGKAPMTLINRSSSATFIGVAGAAILLLIFFGQLALNTRLATKNAQFYATKLGDTSFRWYGATSNQISIPTDHAARALAFVGDESVPYLLQAIEKPHIDRTSIYLALEQIGLPVDEYKDDIYIKNDASRLKNWFDFHQISTKEARSKWRMHCGLPEL